LKSFICSNINCNVEFIRKNSAVREYPCCSSACAYIARKQRNGTSDRGTCGTCGIKISRRGKYCIPCFGKLQSDRSRLKMESITIADIKSKYDSDNSLFSRQWTDCIRNYARTYATSDKKCILCGYNKYVELCHYTPITDFNDNATLLEVNGQSNTIYLCPNHHKELDNDLLDPDDILKIENIIRA